MKFRQFLFIIPLGLAGALVAAYLVINHFPERIPATVRDLAREPELLDYPGAERCGECHAEIYAAWKESRHFKAWTSEFYIKDSENRTKEKCLPCHAPKSQSTGNKPEPRLVHRDDGVYCVPCHFKERAMNGPYDLYAPPHPTRQNDDYREGRFCGSCHQKTFKEWEGAGSTDTCQSCHMPRASGRLTQKFPLSLLHRKREVADHRFLHGELNDDAVRLEATLGSRTVSIALVNPRVPHLVPTADNGDPRLYLYVTLKDRTGEAVDAYKEILAPQQDTALPPGKQIRYDYPLMDSVRQVHVSVQYRPAWTQEKREILQQVIERPAR